MKVTLFNALNDGQKYQKLQNNAVGTALNLCCNLGQIMIHALQPYAVPLMAMLQRFLCLCTCGNWSHANVHIREGNLVISSKLAVRKCEVDY